MTALPKLVAQTFAVGRVGLKRGSGEPLVIPFAEAVAAEQRGGSRLKPPGVSGDSRIGPGCRSR